MGVQAPFLLAAILLASSSVKVLAADPGPGPIEPSQPPHSQTPQLPPPAPPSRIDPGIQKGPTTIPDPKAVVPPPVIDPHMAIDPEKSPRPGDTTPPPMPGGSPAPQR